MAQAFAGHNCEPPTQLALGLNSRPFNDEPRPGRPGIPGPARLGLDPVRVSEGLAGTLF